MKWKSKSWASDFLGIFYSDLTFWKLRELHLKANFQSIYIKDLSKFWISLQQDLFSHHPNTRKQKSVMNLKFQYSGHDYFLYTGLVKFMSAIHYCFWYSDFNSIQKCFTSPILKSETFIMNDEKRSLSKINYDVKSH